MSEKTLDVIKWIVAMILFVLIIAMIVWIVSDMIGCATNGGVYVKGFPWYTCIGAK